MYPYDVSKESRPIYHRVEMSQRVRKLDGNQMFVTAAVTAVPATMDPNLFNWGSTALAGATSYLEWPEVHHTYFYTGVSKYQVKLIILLNIQK